MATRSWRNEVIDFTLKHTARVGDVLGEIIKFANTSGRSSRLAMRAKLGADADEVMKTLVKNGLSRGFAKQALELIPEDKFTIFAIVDALTRLAGQVEYAGDRTDRVLGGGAELPEVHSRRST